MKKFSDFNIRPNDTGWVGQKIDVDQILNIAIIIHKFSIEDSTKNPGTKYLKLQLEIESIKRITFINAKTLMQMISNVPEDGFPFTTTIVKRNNRLEFS